MDGRTLRRILERASRRLPTAERIALDPVSLPRRYDDPGDREVAALLAAALAYGRVESFRPKIEQALEILGPRPARRIVRLTPRRALSAFEGFRHRFHRAEDLAALTVAIGRVVRRHTSLGGFLSEVSEAGRLPFREGLSAFVRGLRAAEPHFERPARASFHLLPDPANGSACKRLNLLLRWMVRPDDGIDFGLWTTYRPADLIVPLDVHVCRAARILGLSERRTADWRMAEEVTAGLARVAPRDPLRYDFHLCHLGMLRRELTGC